MNSLILRALAWVIALSSIVILVTFGCTRNDKNPVGPKLPDDDWFGDGPFLDTLFTDDQLTVRMEEAAGASSFLVVGSHDKLLSRALMRFLALPSVDSVLTAKIEFYVHDLIGADALTVAVYLLNNSEWVEAEATWDLVSGKEDEDPVSWGVPGGDFDDVPIASAEVTSSLVDSTFSLDLDPTIISSWIDSTRENAGLILVLENEGAEPGLVEFRSRQMASAEEFLGPKLFLEYTKEDDPDSTVEGSLAVTEDATIYHYDGAVPIGSLRVGSLPQYRTFISFDISDFSEATSVRRATLFLPILDRTPPDRDITVGTYVITGEWEADQTPLNFTPLDTVEVDDEGRIELDVTDLVWGWVSGTVENNGVSIKTSVERGKFGYVDFEEGSGSMDSGPFCVIEYSEPPSVSTGSEKRIVSHE